MRADLQRCPVVVVGSWNQAIFLPPFIDSVVMPGLPGGADSLEIGLRWVPGDMVLEYTGPSFVLAVHRDRLILRPVDIEANTLSVVDQAATRILTKLPQTPLTSLGINFGFTAEPAEGQLAQMIRYADEETIKAAGAIVRAGRIRRELTLSNGTMVNVTVSTTTGETAMNIDLNFRRAVATAEELCVDTVNVNARKEEALELLRNIYGLELS